MGTVPITLRGAVGSVVLTGGPLRLQLDRGAGSVILPWAAPGVLINPTGVVQAPGWTKTPNRYAMRALASIGSLIVRPDPDE